MAEAAKEGTGCWRGRRQGAHDQARRERVARNDQRSRDIFRDISSLKASVELETAQGVTDKIARGAACGGPGRGSDGRNGGTTSTLDRNSSRLSTGEAELSRSHCCDQNHRGRHRMTDANRPPLPLRQASLLCASGKTHRSGAPVRLTSGRGAARTFRGSMAQGSGDVAAAAAAAAVGEREGAAGITASGGKHHRKRALSGDDNVIDLSDKGDRASKARLPWGPGGLPAPTTAAKHASHRQLSIAETAVQRRPWGADPPQRRPPQQQEDFPSFALDPQHPRCNGRGGDIAIDPAPVESKARSPSGGDENTCLERNRQEQGQPPFVVVGLIGEFGDRVLLLPTTRERRRAMKAASGAAVPLTWPDAGGVVRTATLIRTKAKPIVCNPLPMLVDLLAWVHEFSAEALPEARRPILPACFSERERSCSGSSLRCDNGSSSSTGGGGGGGNSRHSHDNSNDHDEGHKSRNTRESRINDGNSGEGTKLSLAAAWLLGHLTFGRGGDVEHQSVFFRASSPQNGRVNLSGGEAAALSLLRCPLIGWNPRPQEVMEALAEGEGNLCAYSVSPSEFDFGLKLQESTVAAAAGAESSASPAGTKDGGWGSEARGAAAELVRAGLARTSAIRGTLTLAPKMEETCELVLRIILGTRDTDREGMARTALGLVKTGSMTTGVHPPATPSHLESCRSAQQQARGERGSDASACPNGIGAHERGVAGQWAATGDMGGLVGDLCVKLHKWCFEVLRPPANAVSIDLSILGRISENEVSDDPASPLVWSGPMSQALGLLGGATGPVRSSSRSNGIDTASGGTGGIACERDWMAALSKAERLREAACLRLKEASARVVVLISSVIEGLQKQKMYGQAVKLLRLLVRRDQGLAGRQYADAAPDLLWAAHWVTSNHRGYAYTRLAINLKHLKQPGRRQLETVRDACEDDDVRGGERVELSERHRKLQRDHGDSQESPAKDQQYRAIEQTVVVRMDTQKEGNRRSNSGGRKLYFDRPDRDQQRWGEKNALNVEQVLRRERYRSGGWLGIHCESSLIMFLVVLLTWEEIFDPQVKAVLPHCTMTRPADLLDKFFCVRREGLSSRLLEIYRSSDEELWSDVGLRYERYNGVTAVWCDWRRFPKQQVLEISVSFGGRRFSELLRTITNNLPYLRCGFPDVVLWRPKSRKGGASRASGINSGTNRKTAGSGGEKEVPWDSRTHFGLDWQGNGLGWEVEVVEVKSKGDVISDVQKAWLMELENARVPAMIARVLAENEVA